MFTTASFVALLHGFWVTISLTLASLTLGGMLAFAMTACLFCRIPLLRPLVQALIYFVRGTPLLIQIFIIYFGLSQLALIHDTFLWWWFVSPWRCATLALAINTACYTTVLFEGAIEYSVPHNEIAATVALGMTPWLAFRKVIFPRAFLLCLPAYSNEVMIIVKSTALAFTITLMDLMGETQALIADTYNTMQWYAIVGAIYLLINGMIYILFQCMQKHFRLRWAKG